MKLKRLETPNSELAFYRACTPAQPKSTLVLGHALGANRKMWEKVLPLLPEDIEVILWELPGHGNSGLVDSPEAAGVLPVAQSLHRGMEDLGLTQHPTMLGGLSLGGTVALAYAQEHPGKLDGLLLFGSAPALPPPSAWSERAEQVLDSGLEPLVAPTMERWFSKDFREGSGAEAVAQTAKTFVSTNPQGYAQCAQMIGGTDLWPRVGRVGVPVLVTVGSGDAGMSPAQGEELAAALPNGQCVVIDGVKHLMAVEAPEEVAALITQMLR